MEIPAQADIGNKLLSLLPPGDFAQMAAHLEHVAMPRGTPICDAGGPIEWVHFLRSGIGSVVAETPEGSRAEAGLFGFEGFVPTSTVAAVEFSTHHVGIQVDADAHRMPYEAFQRCMDNNRNISRIMIRANEAFNVQVAFTAASNALHDVTERLARWLLMCHDRVHGNEVALTHDFLSLMLAVRRPSVTTSLHVLEGNGFIKAERGVVMIRNRPALQEFAHDAYGKPEEEYRRLMKDIF